MLAAAMAAAMVAARAAAMAAEAMSAGAMSAAAMSAVAAETAAASRGAVAVAAMVAVATAARGRQGGAGMGGWMSEGGCPHSPPGVQNNNWVSSRLQTLQSVASAVHGRTPSPFAPSLCQTPAAHTHAWRWYTSSKGQPVAQARA